MCLFQELKLKKVVMEVNKWRYFQLKHSVAALPHPIRDGDDLTPFKRLCTMEKARGNILRIYKILMEVEGLEMPTYIKKWEEELGK